MNYLTVSGALMLLGAMILGFQLALLCIKDRFMRCPCGGCQNGLNTRHIAPSNTIEKGQV